MPTLRQLLCASLATGLFLTSGSAEARFGKHSSSDDSSSNGGKKEAKHEAPRTSGTHDATPVRSRPHDATPVGRSRSDGGSRGSGGWHRDGDDRGSRGSYSGGSSGVVLVTDPGPPPTYPYEQEPVAVEEARPRYAVRLRMGVEGQVLSDGSAVALHLGLEGPRWGVNGAMTSLTLPAGDGTEGEDKIRLLSAHLTYALLTSDEGRLRAEAGVTVANAPEATFLGPSLAVSFERCLAAALDVEGRGQLVPVPYLQLDAQAGLALHLGVLTLRGGWRWLMLDDRGLVDGEAHRDIFSGPYAGLGLNI